MSEEKPKPRLIRHASELPKWFDLKKYRDLPTILASDKDLHSQLIIRRKLLDGEEMLYEMFESLRDVDLAFIASGPVLAVRGKVEDPLLSVQIGKATLPADGRRLLIRETLASYFYILGGNINLVDDEVDDHTTMNSLLAMGDKLSSAYIEVDMLGNDSEILAAFKEWLIGYREEIGDQATKSREVIKKTLFSHHVIACLDLKIWQRLANVKITDNLVGETLYPYLDNFDKRLETVNRYADLAISNPFLNSLKNSKV